MKLLIGFGNLKKNSPNGIEFRDGKRTLYFQGQAVAHGQLAGEFAPRAITSTTCAFWMTSRRSPTRLSATPGRSG